MRVAFFNCNSIRSNAEVCKQLCEENDIVLIQELMVPRQMLGILNNIHPDFIGRGVSPVDYSDGILRVAVLAFYGGDKLIAE